MVAVVEITEIVKIAGRQATKNRATEPRCLLGHCPPRRCVSASASDFLKILGDSLGVASASAQVSSVQRRDGVWLLNDMSTNAQRRLPSECIRMSANQPIQMASDPDQDPNPAQQQTHQQHKRKCRVWSCSPTRLLLLAAIVTLHIPTPALAFHNAPADNHKPAFMNCAGYAPKVKEEQPENTYVFMVKAVDPDPDQEIRYSIVQAPVERSKFFINPTSGVIVTAHTFDRDEPIHEKFVFVTVQATDNGLPALDDVCTFNVTIEDINDNAPVFNKARYDESISENAQVSWV